MSFSYIYLTRRQFLMNYRDAIGVGIIASYFGSKFLTYNSKKSENDWTMTRVYTDDETDVHYRDVTNKVDAAVKRDKIAKFARDIKAARAPREREMHRAALSRGAALGSPPPPPSTAALDPGSV